MNVWRQSALYLYYWSTLPARRGDSRRRAADATEPVQVLFYHRVADDHPNDWTIGTRAFERQINWIRRRSEIVSLAEAQRRIASGSNRRPTVAITFDDGYADNCRTAVPFLLRNDIPFTYFVTTQHVQQGIPFEHDLEAGQPLRPNSMNELRALAAAGVDIGSHTCTHADLGGMPTLDELLEEIAGSKQDLEHALDVEIRYFAFPFGLPDNMSVEAFRVALDAGYEGVCSAYGAYNAPGDDPFHIRRIHGDPELIRLKNWLTLDPRKRNPASDFEPGDYRVPQAIEM